MYVLCTQFLSLLYFCALSEMKNEINKYIYDLKSENKWFAFANFMRFICFERWTRKCITHKILGKSVVVIFWLFFVSNSLDTHMVLVKHMHLLYSSEKLSAAEKLFDLSRKNIVYIDIIIEFWYFFSFLFLLFHLHLFSICFVPSETI